MSLWTLPALVLCPLLAGTLHADTMGVGSAIVTSRSGSVIAENANSRRVSTDAHSIHNPAGFSWSTQKDSQLFLTFSNGVALALDGDSSVRCVEFSQRPFGEGDIELGRESSVSKLRLQLDTGRIALASNRLSPLSELRIVLPFGEARLHKGTCLIEFDSMGLYLTALEGNLTYYYPDSDSREYVTAPRSVRISEPSAARQQIAEATTADTLEAAAQLLGQAAQHASQRVIFQPNEGTGHPPKPVLVVKPQYFEQPPLRPYQFED